MSDDLALSLSENQEGRLHFSKLLASQLQESLGPTFSLVEESAWTLSFRSSIYLQRINFLNHSYDLWMFPYDLIGHINRTSARMHIRFPPSVLPNDGCSPALYRRHPLDDKTADCILEQLNAFWTEAFNLDGSTFVLNGLWFKHLVDDIRNICSANQLLYLNWMLDYYSPTTTYEERNALPGWHQVSKRMSSPETSLELLSGILNKYFTAWESKTKDEVDQFLSDVTWPD